ncbi:hypothetical protein [Zwartia panacis]|uniref:hypothetical protein n=1 Tax=Zwartia panacis TaxID=2683345 RepID=UPI0025B34A53|nr:hypothetical protein [Zwartia panacis]MDN4016771.1 hypothetical protein [Zwartia panacis]
MKKTRPELKSAASGRPGEGILVLSGWESSTLEIGASAEVCIQRNQDHRYLGEHAQWVATQTWHQVSLSEELSDDAVVLTFDARLVDPLIENPQMTYQLQARIGTESGVGVMRIREGIMSSRAAGQSADPVTHVARPIQQVPVVEATQVVPEPEINAESAPVVMPDPKKSKTGLLIGLVVLFLLLIAGYFAWKHLSTPETPSTSLSTPSTPPVVTSAPVEPPACSAEALKVAKDDLVFIQSCLKTNPESDQVLSVIAAAKDLKRCDVVQRLYAFKGQSGDAKIALAYAREFDPATFVAGCLTAADKETAIYWYELVLSKEPENAEVKARIEALRK